MTEEEFVTISYKEFAGKLELCLKQILHIREKIEIGEMSLSPPERMTEILDMCETLPAYIELIQKLPGNFQLSTSTAKNIEILINASGNSLWGFDTDVFHRQLGGLISKLSEDKKNTLATLQIKMKSDNFYEKIRTSFETSSHYLHQIEDKVKAANRLYEDNALKGFDILYAQEAKKHGRSSILWLYFAFLFNVFLLCSIIFCFTYNANNLGESNKSLFIVASEITFNLVLLSVVLWCAKMYSIGKALDINYKHKSVSAKALLSFLAAIDNGVDIKDDKQTKEAQKIKNTILLEVSRMIFAQPETGLTTKNDKLNMKLLETIKDISPTTKG